MTVLLDVPVESWSRNSRWEVLMNACNWVELVRAGVMCVLFFWRIHLVADWINIMQFFLLLAYWWALGVWCWWRCSKFRFPWNCLPCEIDCCCCFLLLAKFTDSSWFGLDDWVDKSSRQVLHTINWTVAHLNLVLVAFQHLFQSFLPFPSCF